jgi:hypothetical protein
MSSAAIPCWRTRPPGSSPLTSVRARGKRTSLPSQKRVARTIFRSQSSALAPALHSHHTPNHYMRRRACAVCLIATRLRSRGETTPPGAPNHFQAGGRTPARYSTGFEISWRSHSHPERNCPCATVARHRNLCRTTRHWQDCTRHPSDRFSGTQHPDSGPSQAIARAMCVFRACRAGISLDAGPRFHNHAGPRFHGMPVQADAGAGTVPSMA